MNKINKTLSIGILSWNSPISLNNSLKSYKYCGLFDLIEDIICLINKSDKENEEIEICKKFNIKYILSKNEGISKSIRKLVKSLKNEFILFLECDWVLIKNKKATKELINKGIQLIENNNFSVIRLRNLKNPGHPIHWISHYDSKAINSELYLTTHYLNEPHKKYHEQIKKINSNPKIFEISSEFCVYTNNPTIMKKDFYENFIFNYIDKHCCLEPAIANDWINKKFKIAITNGIFSHERIDGHTFEHAGLYENTRKKNCYCCPSKWGGSSDNINCICCLTPHQPTYFENKISLINDNIEEDLDEDDINLKIKKLNRNYFMNNLIK